MEFKKYPHITNVQDNAFVEKVKETIPDIGWVITEKVHGANFQIECDKNGNLKCGTRVRYIPDNENFNQHKQILDKYGDKIKRATHILVSEMIIEIRRIIFYGEIFGGAYPHKEVPVSSHSTKVQHGIWYCPDNDWMCFDILIEFVSGESTYVSPIHIYKLCTAFDIPTVPIVGVLASLKNALEIPCVFDTSIPDRYHLPAIEDNKAEGTVIKPYRDTWIGDTRVIFKNKNPKFREKTRIKHLTPKKQEELQGTIAEIAIELSSYITANRLDNVISHGIDATPNNIGTLIKELWHDAVDEYERDTANKFGKLDKKDQHKISRSLNKSVVTIVKERIYKEG